MSNTQRKHLTTSGPTYKPLAVVILTPGFPADESDTSCLPILQAYIRALADSCPEWEVHVVSLQYPFRRKTYRWHAATVHPMGGANRRFPMRFVSWFRARRRIRRLSQGRNVLAIHSFWLSEATLVGQWVCRRFGIRQVGTIMGQDARAENRYLRYLDFRRMAVVACSSPAAEVFRESMGREVDRVIPIGLDREDWVSPPDPVVRDIDIFGAFNLGPVKDVPAFADVAARIAEAHPDVRIVMAGEGKERPFLEQRIRDGFGGRMELAGHVPREEVRRLMARSKILLHTSNYEGQGYVFLEALASGMHVVCRPVGYLPESPGVHRCRTENEMVEAILRILRSENNFSPIKVPSVSDTVEQYLPFYLRDPVRP